MTDRIREPRPGRWLFTWRIHNRTDHPMHCSRIRVPHGKFKAEERRLEPSLGIATRDSATLAVSVYCHESPGSTVENAFLILFTEWRGTRWRIFVRLRITIDPEGQPETKTELVTAQKVGFSEAV
ncbi:MAG TPA: hypothetical protein VFG65_00555 [Fimbriimonadales bacterium]|nr:hypothetical protein [Fimbriimonadales bacterium]